MTKVIIDSFDTEEQAVAFADWLNKQMYMLKCRLVTTQGVMLPSWDGVDTNETDEHKITVNICVYADDEDEGF